MEVPAVVAAGDARAAKAVHGESKPYLQLGGRALVEHVVDVLQDVPEVSEVWVVGNADRLESLFGGEAARAKLRKPLHVVPQFRNLYENAWQTYRRLLPGAGSEGRDPGPADEDRAVLFLSADLPFATPQEISDFVRRGLDLGCDYTLGLCTEESMVGFYPSGPDAPGIRMAYFNLREGRFRQSNLHLVKPARLGHRYYIEEMYEHRYQKQLGQALKLAWRLMRVEGGGFSVLWVYMLIHLAAVADRHRLQRLADWLRHRIPMERIERGLSTLLDTDFRFLATEVGGCAVDIDNDPDYDAASQRFEEWRALQKKRAEELHGPVALSARAGSVNPQVGP